MQNRETRYVSPTACKHCGFHAKYTTGGGCVICTHRRNTVRRQRQWASLSAAQKQEYGQRQRQVAGRERLAQWARNSHLKRTYGLTQKSFQTLLLQQGGTCAICFEAIGQGTPLRAVVDHDHESGTVRGLLCDRCNHALGHLKESAEIARRAALYLQGIRRYG